MKILQVQTNVSFAHVHIFLYMLLSNMHVVGVNVGVHQGSVMSPLLFIIVMEAVTHNVREGLPWEMLYADDLVLVGKCEEELKEKLRKWNECLKDKGLKINEEKTKVMCESFGTGTTQVIGNVKHTCSVCLKGVGVNSIRCTQ